MIVGISMNRRVLALLLIPLILLLYGCNSSSSAPNSLPPLTKEEYGEAVDKAWEKYRDGYGEFIKIAAEAGNDFSKMKEKASELLSACEKMDRALEEFEKLAPPSEFKELHDKLLKSIKDEKRWQEYRKKGYNAKTEEESNKYFDEIAEEINAADVNELFPHLYLEIHKIANGNS